MVGLVRIDEVFGSGDESVSGASTSSEELCSVAVRLFSFLGNDTDIDIDSCLNTVYLLLLLCHTVSSLLTLYEILTGTNARSYAPVASPLLRQRLVFNPTASCLEIGNIVLSYITFISVHHSSRYSFLLYLPHSLSHSFFVSVLSAFLPQIKPQSRHN